jgi:hypothetical protein
MDRYKSQNTGATMTIVGFHITSRGKHNVEQVKKCITNRSIKQPKRQPMYPNNGIPIPCLSKCAEDQYFQRPCPSIRTPFNLGKIPNSTRSLLLLVAHYSPIQPCSPPPRQPCGNNPSPPNYRCQTPQSADRYRRPNRWVLQTHPSSHS